MSVVHALIAVEWGVTVRQIHNGLAQGVALCLFISAISPHRLFNDFSKQVCINNFLNMLMNLNG